METLNQIKQAIIEDPDNQEFALKGWEPVYIAYPQARILIIGQAPGLKTQEVNQVFRDRSGDRLRSWLGVDAATFYHGEIAVLPMDFYFPGHMKGKDAPPRVGFAQKWHPRILSLMPQIELTILIGLYAQKAYLTHPLGSVTANVLQGYREENKQISLIHPSPRNQIWMKKHPEFAEEILPKLRKRIEVVLQKK